MKNKIKDTSLISLFAGLIAVSSYLVIPLPFSPVPITAQTIIIMLAGTFLKPIKALTSVGIFIFLGIAGLPVFSKGQSGLGVIAGPTGGYLIGFLFAVYIISILVNKKHNFKNLLITFNLGTVIIYFFGVSWLSISLNISLKKAIITGFIPFIPGDIIKIIFTALLAKKLKKHI